MKISILTLAMLALALVSPAQTLISGRVQEANGNPMPGVNAYLEGTYDGSSSNDQGIFRFTSDETGAQQLHVEFMGFEPVIRSLNLSGDSIWVDIQLKEAFNQLNAVTITAGTFEASDKKQAVTITPLDMVTTAGANGDVYGALQSLPGTTTNGESGRLFVKGGDSGESQTYIDGAWVPVPYNSSAPNLGTRGRFNPFMFQGMVFSTGGYSAEYGQALSSVLLLNTNDLPAEDQLDFSVLSVGADVAGTKRWADGAITATASYQNLSPYMHVVKQNYDWNHAPESTSGALSFRQKTGKSGMLKAYSTVDYSNFNLQQPSLETPGSTLDYALDNRNVFANSSWKGRLSEKLGLNAAASYTNNTDDIAYGESSLTNTQEAFYLKAAFNYSFSDRLLLKTGGEWFTQQLGQEGRSEEGTFNTDLKSNTLTAFAEAQVYASNKFVSRLGARGEYSDVLGAWNVAPRLSSAYKLSENTQLSAAYGWFYQPPENRYLLRANELESERADHYTMTFLSSSNERTLRAELYYKDYKQLVKYSLDANGNLSNFSNDGSGYARGLDLFWRDAKTIPGGNYWVSYSYIDTRRNYRDYPYEARPTFASKHNLSVVYKQWFGRLRSLVSANFNYSSPRVYNNPNASVFNNEKMKAYRSLDLSWSFLYRQNIIFYASVTNLTGFENEYGRSYADRPNGDGLYNSVAVQPGANRFFVLACFITLTRGGDANQLDKIQ